MGRHAESDRQEGETETERDADGDEDEDEDVVLLVDRGAKASLLVDISLCAGSARTAAAAWTREDKALVMVVGYLEQIEINTDVRR
jgi:hypothetical protein